MRRLIVFALFASLLLAVPPVVTAQEMDCAHEATIASLRMCVEHAVAEGFVVPGVGNSLLAKLDAAQRLDDAGQTGGAIALLRAFVHEVSAQSGRQIDDEHAAHIIGHAEIVISALGASS